MTDSDSAAILAEEESCCCSQEADLLSGSNKSLFQLPDGWGNTKTSEDDDDNGGPSLLEYRTRIARIQAMHCNETCADCGSENPQWSSLLLNKDDGCMEGLGAVVCEHCALHQHYELGEKRCFIKYLQYFHEWTHPELDVLEHCGNDLLNEVYEAKYFPDYDEEEQQPQRDPTSDKHGKFIRNKYKKCKYLDEDALEEALELVNVRANLAKHSPQISTSSPRRKSSAGSLKLLKQHISCSSLLSLNSELTGSSCCLFDLETDQAEFDAADVNADSDDGISFYDDDDDESIQSVPDETLSLPSLNHPAASENPLILLEVSSVDRKQQQQQHQRPPRRVSKFVRKGRPSCIIQGIPHMEESLRTGDTDDLTYVTKSSSVGGPRSLSPCPPTIRLNHATQAA